MKVRSKCIDIIVLRICFATPLYHLLIYDLLELVLIVQ